MQSKSIFIFLSGKPFILHLLLCTLLIFFLVVVPCREWICPSIFHSMVIFYVKSLWQQGVSHFLPIHPTVSLQLLILIYTVFQEGPLLGKQLKTIGFYHKVVGISKMWERVSIAIGKTFQEKKKYSYTNFRLSFNTSAFLISFHSFSVVW